MRRRLAKLDRQQPAVMAAGYRSPGAAPDRTGDRGTLRRHPVYVLVGAIVLGLTAFTWVHGGWHTGAPGSTPGMPLAGGAVRRPGATDAPPAGRGERKHRLATAVAGPAGAGGYRFLETLPSGGPVTYDPCRPIHYVIREHQTPSGGDILIRRAVARVAAATGLVFIDDGSTTEAPSTDRPDYQPGRYGKTWAPVLIAWTDPQEFPDLAGSTIGLGGSRYRELSSATGAVQARAYVSGSISLDAPQLAGVIDQDGAAAAQAVILHELGHLVGLGHVNDPHQLMYPESALQETAYGDGDLRGLARLGAGSCQPSL
jgi:hypothetical protein